MKIFGYLLASVGVIYLFIAFNMDVSISTSPTYLPGYGSIGGGDVANLDLMAQRQNHVIVAALITLVGTLMAIFGKNEVKAPAVDRISSAAPEKSDYSGERDLASDHYRLWLADHYEIARNDVFDRFVADQQTFNSLDDALANVHGIEMQRIADEKAENERIEAENERIEAEVAANREAACLAQEEAEAAFREARPKIIVGAVIAIALLVAASLFFKETPDERSARLAREEAERAELFENIEERFKVSLPKDASAIGVIDNAADYDFFCNDQKGGVLLKFQTSYTEEAVQKLFAEKLGKGEPQYDLLPVNFDWSWTKSKVHYELSMPGEGPPTGVNFCMVK